jgi:hypothetical protein
MSVVKQKSALARHSNMEATGTDCTPEKGAQSINLSAHHYDANNFSACAAAPSERPILAEIRRRHWHLNPVHIVIPHGLVARGRGNTGALVQLAHVHVSGQNRIVTKVRRVSGVSSQQPAANGSGALMVRGADVGVPRQNTRRSSPSKSMELLALWEQFAWR